MVATNGFEKYDFQSATTAIYNFWLYDLCDWYVVSNITFLIDVILYSWPLNI